MLIYKRFLLLTFLTVSISFIAGITFGENIWMEFLLFLLVFAILYTLFIIIPYKSQHRFILLKNYVIWIEKGGTFFDVKK